MTASLPRIRSAPTWACAFLWTTLPVMVIAGEDPEVQFDFPRAIACRDVTTPEFLMERPEERLIEAVLPVSVVVYRGDVQRIQEVVLELDGTSTRSLVYAHAPMTRLDSEIALPIEVKTTNEKTNSLEGKLGANVSVPLGPVTASIGPSVTAGTSKREAVCETVHKLPPKEAIVVSGTTNRGQAVFYKFRPSTQTTLEGEQEVRIQLAVPQSWKNGKLKVTCVARGKKKFLWMEEAQTWGSRVEPVKIYLAGRAWLEKLR